VNITIHVTIAHIHNKNITPIKRRISFSNDENVIASSILERYIIKKIYYVLVYLCINFFCKKMIVKNLKYI